MTHPHAALHNAKKYFQLNKLEEEIILTPNLPKGRTMQRMSPELDEDILLELDCL